MSKIQTLRGMNDIGPHQAKEWSYVEDVIKSVVESYVTKKLDSHS